jgi:hypothetical protein
MKKAPFNFAIALRTARQFRLDDANTIEGRNENVQRH